MANKVMLRAKGLFTFQNFLSAIPEGALLDATNVVIDRDGVIEPRRGIHEYGDFGLLADRAKQLLNYKNRILAHYDSTIAYDDGTGTFADFSESFSEVDSGLRIKGVELNGNFYVTTSSGIKKIEANSSDLSTAIISDAGGVKALNGTAVVNYSTAGFFLGHSKVAYRIVWGIKDINNNLILGSPSSRIVITNFSENSGTVDLTFGVPNEITSTDYFYQIYRTSLITLDPFTSLADLDSLDPGDEMRLVYEANVTSSEISSNSVEVNDVTPEDFQLSGDFLYTNPVTGEGILQSNEKPPVAKDIALFKNSIFYANTRTRHRLDLNLLGIGAISYGDISSISDADPAVITSNDHGLSNGDRIVIVGTGSGVVDAEHVVSNVTTNTFEIPVDGTGASDTTGTWFSSYITVTDGSTTNRYFFVGRPEVTEIVFDTQANTTDGSWFEISAANDLVQYFIWFDKTGSTTEPTVSGKVGIRVDISPPVKASKIMQDLTYTADNFGEDGNNISVEYTDGGTAGSETVTVVGTAITVQIQGGVSTATQIKAAVDGNATAAALVDITISGAGANPQGTQAATFLEDGEDGPASSDNVAPYVQEAVELATSDFAITESPAGTLTFITANNGPATDAAAGTTAPGGVFAFTIEQQGFGEDLTKNYIRLSGYISPAQAVDDTARSMVDVISLNPSEIVYGYYLSGPDQIPGIMNFESRELNDITFSFMANNSDVGALFNPDLTTAAESTNEESPNRLYFSKYQQPEAVPLVNYLDIGPKDKAILRIIALRDSLFIFKEDGIYRLTGEISPNFSATLFDNSTQLIAPDTAAVLNNQIYCLSDGGIATVTETGVGIVSRPIENVFTKITTDNYPNFSTASFGLGYETDRSYYIWTVTEQDDTFATQCFRYNTFTQCWTRWDKPQTCGIVNSFNNRLYFGSTDSNFVEIERKSLTRRDYADREFSLQIPDNAVHDNELILSSVINADPGDAVVQVQYVTVDQFNMLLIKLDSDPRIGVTPGTFDNDYFATLEMSEGDNLSNKMIDLVNKLNADPGTDGGYAFTGTTDFETIQDEYNTMVAALNVDSKLKFSNYQESNGTIEFEMTVTEVDINKLTVVGESVPNFMVGPITLYKGINTSIVWAPSDMGDPSLLKHIRESTILFETSDFLGGEVAYSTDLSPSFERIQFVMDGNGTWGGFFWGEATWGGSGSSVPFRTYIPRQKQRCRYIKCRFMHKDAFYKFSILGNSYVFEVNSERAYRGTT